MENQLLAGDPVTGYEDPVSNPTQGGGSGSTGTAPAPTSAPTAEAPATEEPVEVMLEGEATTEEATEETAGEETMPDQTANLFIALAIGVVFGAVVAKLLSMKSKTS